MNSAMDEAPLRLAPGVLDEIIAHAIDCLPDEACGLLVGQGRHVEAFRSITNIDPSPRTYTLDPEEHFRVLRESEREGWEIVGAFHSHPASAAVPSVTDVALAREPDWVWLIAGPVTEVARFRAWLIRDGRSIEVGLG